MMPGIPDVPGSPRSAAPSLGSLMGPQPASMPMMGANAANQGVMQQVRDLTAGMDALASQYPEIASDMQQAKQLVVSAMVKVVGNSPSPEPPSPAVLG